MAQSSPVIHEGWMLKKRRKKMQGAFRHAVFHNVVTTTDCVGRAYTGFARRYFILHESGLLEYSFEPGKPIRDELFIPSAAISTTPGHRDIHLDGDNAIFHVKCLTTEDFNKWMAAFRCVDGVWEGLLLTPGHLPAPS
jgi:oxysterol-binding protein-related protein 3/6/7